MHRYILIRLMQAVLTLFVVSLIVFGLARLSGSPLDTLVPEEADPETTEAISELWGLDQSYFHQYLVFAKNASTLEFGPSFHWQGRTARDMVEQTLPHTLRLAGFALLFAVLMAVPIGVITAYKKGTATDTGGKIIALLGQSMPSFWLAIVLIWVFAVGLGWFPTSGTGGWKHYVLPVIALGWFQVAAFMRLTRSSMLNVLDTNCKGRL